MMAAAPPGMVSVTDAATQLGLAKQRIYQLIRMGQLRFEQQGQRVWIPQEAIDDRLAGERMLNSPNCISTSEVAEFFGVDEKTVRQWHSDGALRARKIHNRLCFPPADVAKFVPPTYGRQGRLPGKVGTRMLRGRYFPPPPGMTQ